MTILHVGRFLLLASAGLVALVGCRSPYRSDQGALFGGLTGGGVGAIVGHQLGNTGAGAAIGAGVGALTGAAVGSELDEIEASNRAEIEARLGRQVAPGSTSIGEVVAMSQSGVSDQTIIKYIQIHGVQQTPTPDDLRYMKQQGVPDSVVQTMLQPPPPLRTASAPRDRTVVVEEYHYGPPRPWGWHRHYYRPPPRPGVSFGWSYHGH